MRTKILFLFFFIAVNVQAAVKLPKIFTDNMVLQRNKPIRVWGWANKGSVVTITLNTASAKGKSDKTGYWEATLPAMPHGGPYELKVSDGKNQQTLKNILVGDVWFCSGQSNMEMPIQGWNKDSIRNAGREIKAANYPSLRMFTVVKGLQFEPAKDLEGGTWQECTPANAGAFSATAYFFGRKLLEELDVPIGLINSSWGGTNIEAWTSWDFMGKLPEYASVKPAEMKLQQQQWAGNRQKYEAALQSDAGKVEKWYSETYDAASWPKVNMPLRYENSAIGNADGLVWYRKEFILTSAQAATHASINLGAIDDQDETYVNGLLVGKTNLYSANRNYKLDGVVKKGKNIIVVRSMDTGGGGGFTGTADDLYITAGSDKISLAGEWQYQESVTTTKYNVMDTGPNGFPSQLYNAMVAPLIKLSIKGVIWYQGESNADAAYDYRTRFPNMISDWRQKWHDAFPFFWVQLANYMQPVNTPSESTWAELREAQHMTLSLPQTGEAVTIDIGEANDIHPRNKQDVGKRLALSALKVAYQKDIVFSGPVYQSMEIQEDRIVLTFTQSGTGLKAMDDRYGYLRGFAIAGQDQKFVWAQAKIENGKVIVSSDKVKRPVAIRYAWSDNPDDANLYNAEGLPASPFRTDNWKGVTQKD